MADVLFERWDEWYGSVVGTSVFDAPAQVFVAAQGEFMCFDLCRTPEEVSGAALAEQQRPAFLEAERRLDELYERRAPIDGPVGVIGKTSSLQREIGRPRPCRRGGIFQLASVVFDDSEGLPIGGVLVDGETLTCEGFGRQRRIESTLGSAVSPG